MDAREHADVVREALSRDKGMVCGRCGDNIYRDPDGGYWIHKERRDGMNGLYCTPESWEKDVEKKWALPVSKAEASLDALVARVEELERERDEALEEADGMARAPYGQFAAAFERAKTAESRVATLEAAQRTALQYLTQAIEATGSDEEELCARDGNEWAYVVSAMSALEGSHEN